MNSGHDITAVKHEPFYLMGENKEIQTGMLRRAIRSGRTGRKEYRKPQRPHPLYSTVCPFLVSLASYRAMSAHPAKSSNVQNSSPCQAVPDEM